MIYTDCIRRSDVARETSLLLHHFEPMERTPFTELIKSNPEERNKNNFTLHPFTLKKIPNS